MTAAAMAVQESDDWRRYHRPESALEDDGLSPMPKFNRDGSIPLSDPLSAQEILQTGPLAIRGQRAAALLIQLEHSFHARERAARAAPSRGKKSNRPISVEEQIRNRQELQQRAMRALSPSSPEPSSGPVLSAPAYRSQLRTRFDETFFPCLVRGGGAFYPYYGFSLLGDNWSPAVQAAGDAMCVLQLGVQFSHREMLLGFHSLYARALTQMRRELQSGQALRQPDDIMCAATLLTICEGMISSSYDSAGWNTHLRGLLDFLAACGPDVLNGTEKRFTDAAWFHNWRMMALGYGLGARQRLLVEDKAWQRGGAAVDPLTENMLRVPGWLQDLDSLAVARTSLEELAPIYARAVALSADMREQIKMFASVAPKAPGADPSKRGPPFILVPISTFAAFTDMLGPELADVVPEAYLFTDMIAGGLHKTYWTCQLLLDQSLLDLREIHPSLLTDEKVAELEQERDDCVKDLTRTIPFFSAPAMGSVGLLGVRGPIHFATLHYARFSDEQHLRWCQRAADGVVLGSRVLKVLAEGARRIDGPASSSSQSTSPPTSHPANTKGKSKARPPVSRPRQRPLGGGEMQGGRWKEIPRDYPPSKNLWTEGGEPVTPGKSKNGDEAGMVTPPSSTGSEHGGR